jgi:hypothetical protein
MLSHDRRQLLKFTRRMDYMASNPRDEQVLHKPLKRFAIVSIRSPLAGAK